MTGRLAVRLAALAAISATTCHLAGCNIIGWGAQAFGPDPHAVVDVEAEYFGLENQSVAVLVDADLATLYRFPTAQLETCAAITQQIAAHVPGVSTVDPRQVVDFQQRNIYWNTATYSNLARRLGVKRLVLIELTEYRLHEPGNVNLFRGVIEANVSVAETDGPHPDDLAYSTHVIAAYPPGRPEGVPDADPVTIRKGALDLFALYAAGKFFEHKEPKP